MHLKKLPKTYKMKNAIKIAESTDYKTEITNQSVTIWFHEGNGINFRAKKTSRNLYLTRYITNGWQNTDQNTIKIQGGEMPKSWQAAQILFEY